MNETPIPSERNNAEGITARRYSIEEVLRYYLMRETSRLSSDSRSHDRSAIDAVQSALAQHSALVEAGKNALLALAAWKITDEQQSYREVGPDLRAAFVRGHDELLEALPKLSNALLPQLQSEQEDRRP